MAHILAVVKTWPANGYRQQAHMTTTGPNGQFSIENVYPSDRRYEVQLAVVADERLLESTYVSDATGELAPFEFRLQPTAAFSVRFRTSEGEPVEGVEAFPFRRVDQGGHDHLVYFQSAEPIVRRSNARGEVRLSCFRAGDKATVYFRPPGRDWQTRDVVIPERARFVEFALADDVQPATQLKDDKGV
jgi:hypothetical protein